MSENINDQGGKVDKASKTPVLLAVNNAIPFFTPAAPVKFPSWLAVAAMSLLISMVASVGSVYVYDRFYAQKVVAVDIKGYIQKQRDLYLAGKLNNEQLKAKIDKLSAVVTAIPKNRVAIMGDVVIKNAEQENLP